MGNYHSSKLQSVSLPRLSLILHQICISESISSCSFKRKIVLRRKEKPAEFTFLIYLFLKIYLPHKFCILTITFKSNYDFLEFSQSFNPGSNRGNGTIVITDHYSFNYYSLKNQFV